ncbi:hypothetical protein [Prauserella cavernicola]|uniref:Uncharacterized protein n=1 Tax=Prauserella cavernicola TaxID=2800127 RepID=A0A934QQW0_9PSEU|nr:hypothetical protein [Prauserella cavernicola]MBK1784428.1 hypothetical protein [Prauserella cavernicola]
MPSGDGYTHNSGALRTIVGHWRDGAHGLDEVAAASAKPPDAGASSGVVGDGIAALLNGLRGAATAMAQTAGRVHAANGAYEDIENTNEGAIAARPRYGTGPAKRLPSDPTPTPGSLPEQKPMQRDHPHEPSDGPGSMDDN